MVNPVELTKLGVKARLQRLGSLKYILIGALLALVLGAIEIARYNQYVRCVWNEVSRVYKTPTQEILNFEHTVAAAEAKCRTNYPYDVFKWLTLLNPINEANAQIKIGAYSENEIRGIVIISIFSCMGVFFFVSTGALLFSKNAKVVAFSMDSVKTLLGFFIGVAMSFMGVR